MGIAEKIFKVRDQRSRPWQIECCNSGNKHFDGVASRLTCW